MVSSRNKTFIRAFVETFPPLKFALQVNDCICYVINLLFKFIGKLITGTFTLILQFVNQASTYLLSILRSLYPFNRDTDYQRLNKKADHKEPVPYQEGSYKRALTYYGGLLLGIVLFLFVYYVLVKHHSYTVIGVAFLLFMMYLVIIENSHCIRSILMLCLPIMLTNRGRALIFCCMLAITVSGPIKNSQSNTNELHLSLNCCKQYMIIKTDKFVDKNIVQNLVKVENIIHNLVDNIKEFARQMIERSKVIIDMAIEVEKFIIKSVNKLKDIVNLCNVHTQDTFNNCQSTFKFAYDDCLYRMGSTFSFLCAIVKPLKETCSIVRMPEVLCIVPRAVISYLDKTIGERMRIYLEVIENEFYVDVDIDHYYSYNGTKSKAYQKIVGEVKFDLEQKFWYIHLINRVFNLVSLILVIWILITATLYHMHYLSELSYDNMYIDGYLVEIDEKRKRGELKGKKKTNLLVDFQADDDDDETSTLKDATSDLGQSEDEKPADNRDHEDTSKFLFPMPKSLEQSYLKPFSVSMNDTEVHKLYIAGLVWLVIVGYISFFVALDFSLYKLIELVDGILNDILFTSDLPLVDVYSKSGDRIVRYNRTHLNDLRNQSKMRFRSNSYANYRNGSLGAMYRRLMDSIEENVPDDVAILDSLQQCLPKATEPTYRDYRQLLYLSIITFTAVIIEAYALRTRHCIANLYYPVRARKRAVWLYRKLLREFEPALRMERDAKEFAIKARSLMQNKAARI